MHPVFALQVLEILPDEPRHLAAKRLVLTHVHENMLVHVDDVEATWAYDGLVVRL